MWMCFSVRSVSPNVMLLSWSGVRLGIGDQSWEVYAANRVSSDLSAFLRLGVPCAAPGLPLGGDGRLGALSAALALSSRNLSNSGCIKPWKWRRKKKSVQNVGGDSREHVRTIMLPYLHLWHLPQPHLLSVEEKKKPWHTYEMTLCQTSPTANQHKPNYDSTKNFLTHSKKPLTSLSLTKGVTVVLEVITHSGCSPTKTAKVVTHLTHTHSQICAT